MEPLRPSYVDLVKPHLPDTWLGGKEIFLNMIDAASSPGFRKRFWKYRYEKQQSNKWIVPGYSGTVEDEFNFRRLVVIDPHAPMIAHTESKKVKAGVEIIVFKKDTGWDTALLVNAIVYKKMTLDLDQNNNPDLSILRTIREHERLSKGCPLGIAAPPVFLNAHYNKKRKAHYIDFEEKKASGTLKRNISLIGANGSKVYLTLGAVAYGFNEIANALLHINKKGKVHADVKCDNILVTLEGNKIHLGLTDFELLSSQGKFFADDSFTAYAYWDQVRGSFKIATPFCDVFGFAQSLGIILFGNAFDEIMMSDEIEDLDETFAIWKENQKDTPFRDIHFSFYHKAYIFIRQVKLLDNVRSNFLTGKEDKFIDEKARVELLNQLPTIKIEECVALTKELITIVETYHGPA